MQFSTWVNEKRLSQNKVIAGISRELKLCPSTVKNAELGKPIFLRTALKIVRAMGLKLSDVCFDLGEVPESIIPFDARTGGRMSHLDWMLWLKSEFGFDRSDFASHTGLPVGYLRQIELGDLTLTEKDLEKISRGLNICIPEWVRTEWSLYTLKKSFHGHKMTFGMWLAVELQLKNMTINELSKRSGASYASIYFLRNDDTKVLLQTLINICEALEITLYDCCIALDI